MKARQGFQKRRKRKQASQVSNSEGMRRSQMTFVCMMKIP